MPTITEMELPKPKNWQEFEHMVCDAMAQRWRSSGLQMYGRPGQTQNGVDINGPDEIGRQVGIQCKRYEDVPSIKLILTEIANAEKFTPKLSTLYIATTADYDSTLQSSVRTLSDERVSKGEFAVSLLFWGDIVRGLILNPAILSAHYPNIVLRANGRADPDRNLAALELGFYCGDLWDFVLLVHGEFGWMAQVDPDSLTATLRMLERRAVQLLSTEESEGLIASLRAVREGCLSPKSSKSDWHLVEQHAKRVESRTVAAKSHLEGDEARWLALACQLGRIYAHSNELPEEQIRIDIEAKVLKLLPLRRDVVKARFDQAAMLSDGYAWADRIYGFLVNELLWA
ncbi:hypothetical protein [Yoonia algicola]|uniref:Restriction endonuclease type IV Mrr domain-containing protein n=1 Tax=Yoonia algicola TaxID=3137368 RepID=A0AAN0M3L6_9RHOB